MIDPSTSARRFNQLIAALSRRTATPLEARDGLLVLVDAGGTVQLVVELTDAGDAVAIVARVMPVPQEDAGGTLALRLLRFNADRAALDGAVIAADGLRRQFVLIRELPLADEAEAVAVAEAEADTEAAAEALAGRIEALMDLAAIVRFDALGERSPGAGTAALLLRASRSLR